MRTPEEVRVRTWVWISLIASGLIAVLSLLAFAVPVTIIKGIGAVGAWLFLYGEPNSRERGVVLLWINAIAESIVVGLLVLLIIILVNNPTYGFGWNLFLAVYVVVAAVPLGILAAVDLCAVYRASKWLKAQRAAELERDALGDAPSLVTVPIAPKSAAGDDDEASSGKRLLSF